MRWASTALVTITMLPVVFLLYTPHARAQSGDPCPGQGHIATSADAPIPIGAKVCPKDLLLLRGGCEFNPYPYLEGQKTATDIQITPVSAENTSGGLRPGIDPMLACRLAKLIRAMGEKGCQIKVKSAYRSVQQQQSICGAGRSGCAAAGTSCHQYGLAVDITSTCIAQLRTYLGTGNPSAIGAQEFKLHFPYYGDHIQCVEHAQASCTPNTSPCGGLPSNPNLATIPSVAFGPSAGVSSNLSLAMNQPLGLGPNSVPIDEPYSAVGNNTTGGNLFANPYNPTQQNQMCLVNTAPLTLRPCGQQSQFMPPTMPPPLPPMPPMMPMQSPPISNTMPAISSATPSNTSAGTGSNINTNIGGTSPTATGISNPPPIYPTTIRPIPSASLIIAQTASIPRNSTTLISWTSVGMIPASCAITQNNTPFGTGPQGSKVLSAESTNNPGTITFIFDCSDFAGVNNKRTINITVE